MVLGLKEKREEKRKRVRSFAFGGYYNSKWTNNIADNLLV